MEYGSRHQLQPRTSGLKPRRTSPIASPPVSILGREHCCEELGKSRPRRVVGRFEGLRADEVALGLLAEGRELRLEKI